MQKFYNVPVDLKRQYGYPRMEFVQGDTNANSIYITVTSDGSPEPLQGKTITVTLKKSDGNIIIGSCVIENDVAIYNLGTNDIAAVGAVIGTVEVYEGTKRLTSSQFQFSVRAQLDDGSGVPSTTEYTALGTLIAQNQAIQTEEAKRVTAENERKTTFQQMQTDTAAAIENINTTNNAIQTEEAQRVIRDQNRETNTTNAINTINATNDSIKAQEAQRVLDEEARETNTTDALNSMQELSTLVQTQETARQNNEADRVQKLQRLTEDDILLRSETAPISLSTEVDAQGRITKKTFKRANSTKTEEITRENFDARNNPQRLVRKLYDESGYGVSKMVHTVGYNAINEPTSDVVTQEPSDISDLSVTRSGIATDPLQSYSPASAPTTFANNVPVLLEQDGTPQLTNNDSFLEIHGNKVHNTFKTPVPSYADRVRRLFVGGDTATFDYDFGLKVANSVAECPMKLYSGLIDPANPPAPTDPLWKEVTSQSVIDRVKAQNELNITSVDTTGRTAVVNGQTLVQQGTNNPAVRDDFAGKTGVDTVTNPHRYFRSRATTLQNPTKITTDVTTGFVEYDSSTQANIDLIKTQNNQSNSYTTLNLGEQPQMLFSFNLIRMIEDKYGLIPVDRTGTAAEVLARQVQWCKDNIAGTGGINFSAYIYGTNPTGNKAYLSLWINNNSWYSPAPSNTANTPTRVPFGTNGNYIDLQGMVHFLAYTDPARTTDSTLLVLTGHGLSTNDLIENVTKGAFRTVTKATNDVLTFIGNAPITGQVGGDAIRKYSSYMSKSAEAGTDNTTVKITGHGLLTGDAVIVQGKGYSRVTKFDDNTLTLNTPITNATTGDTVSLFKYKSEQTAESTVIPSTIYTDYVSLDIQLKASAGYDVLVPQNPRRDAGLGYSVQLQKVYGKQTSDFKNKIQASITENPNIAKCVGDTTLKTPSAFAAELGTSSYGTISSQDNSCWTWGGGTSKSAAGYIDQQLFSFDIIAKFEKDYGTIPITLTGDAATDKVNKIAWLKSANGIKALTAKWYGYGSCPGGNKAYFARYVSTNNSWSAPLNNTATSPTIIQYITTDMSTSIDPNGFIHFLAYTDSSDGVTASTIYTDYISLDIEYNAPNNSIEYFTNNSVELESLANAKAQAYMVETDMTALCNALSGGSNSAFKSLLKSIQADVWAMGSGANAGVLGYQSKATFWDNGSTIWHPSMAKNNNTSAISQCSVIRNDVYTKDFVNTSNKHYLLINATYSSDGTIPSQVSLDYAKLTVALTRQPDIVPPVQINLPKNWAMLVRGFSPSWDSGQTANKYILNLYKDQSNRCDLRHTSSGNFALVKNGNILCTVALAPFSRNKVINFIVGQTLNGMFIKAMQNNGVLISSSNNDILQIAPQQMLYILHASNNGVQADAFAESFHLFDLNELGVTADTLDTFATGKLNGTEPGYENPNLIDMSKITLHPNAVYDVATKTITLNATDAYQTSTIYVPVLPNNRYVVLGSMTGALSKREYYNSINVVPVSSVAINTAFVTGNNTNRLQLNLTNSASGTFTFKDISLVRKD